MEGLLQMILVVILTIIRGAILVVLWRWFVVPLGIPPIWAPHAIGLAGTIAMFIPHKPSRDKVSVWYMLGYATLYMFLALGSGFIVHHWFMPQ